MQPVTYPSDCFKVVERVATGPHIMLEVSHVLLPLMLWTSGSTVTRSTGTVFFLALFVISSTVQPNITQAGVMQIRNTFW